MISIIAAIALGYVIGLLQKGIHVHHHKDDPIPETKEYNESSEDLLPENIRNYMEQNRGFVDY